VYCNVFGIDQLGTAVFARSPVVYSGEIEKDGENHGFPWKKSTHGGLKPH
jgi:hypothetical protein